MATSHVAAAAAAAGMCQMLLKSRKLKAPAEVAAQQERAGDALGKQRLLVKGYWWLWALIAFAQWVLGAELRRNGHDGGEQSPGTPEALGISLQQVNINGGHESLVCFQVPSSRVKLNPSYLPRVEEVCLSQL